MSLIIDQALKSITDAQKVARLEQSIAGLIGTIFQLYDATCDSCPDCNGCGNAHEIAGKALEYFGIHPVNAPDAPRIERMDG